MDTESRYFRVHREDIAYFKFIIESYEGMAVLRTEDPREAVVELMVAPGWEKDLEEVLEGLGKEIPIENISIQISESLPSPERLRAGRQMSNECQSPKPKDS